MTHFILPAPNPASQPGRGDCSSTSFFLFAWLLILALTFGRILTAITLSLFEAQVLHLAPFFMALGQSLLLLVLLISPALGWKNVLFRSIFRSWLVASGFAGLGSFIYLTRPYDMQLHAVLHIAAATVYILAIWLLSGRPHPLANSRPRSRLWLAVVVISALFAYPWLAWGALGSPTDTFLQLLSALFLGLACAITLELYLFPAFFDADEKGIKMPGPGSSIALGGLAAGTVILLIFSGTGYGYHVMQLVLMLALPALGFVVMGLIHTTRLGQPKPEGDRVLRQDRLLPLSALLGLSAAAPMALIDPIDLYLVASLEQGEILQWALSGALLSAVIAIGISVALLILARKQPEPGEATGGAAVYPTSRPGRNVPTLLAAAAGLSVLVAGLIYFILGQPGYHGDTLFVILHEQADLSAAIQIEDLPARRQFVYTELVQLAENSQAGLRAGLSRLNVRYTPYYLVNGIEVHGGPLLRLWLLSQPEVDRVLHNPWMRPLPAERPVSTGEASLPGETIWNLELIRAPQAWETFGVTGEGVVIGQSDSGVEWQHPELLHTYRGLNKNEDTTTHDYNWYDPWYGSLEPVDISGHGTHTLGSIIGQQTGVAPGATWFGCTNLARNLGNPAVYLDCLQFMLAPFPFGGDPFSSGDPARGANILNNSWSCPEVEGCDPTSLLPAVRALRAAGIFIVVSAGNDGPACESLNQPPALYAEVFSVGAIDSAGRLAFFSSLGPVTADGSGRIKPDLVAPGQNVLSAMPGSSYAQLSGTSMAGPHAAGVVALIWSANPRLVGDIERTEQILVQSTQPYEQALPDCPGAVGMPSTAVGYGILDAYEAVRLAIEEE